LDYIIYLLYRFFAFLFHILPKTLIKFLLDFIAYLGYVFDRKHYRIAKANLDLVYGDNKSDKAKQTIIKSSLINMVYNLYEFMVLQRESFEKMEQKMSVENEEIVLKLLEQDKRIITVSGHYGCWELALPFFAIKYNPLTIISRKLNNKYINDIFISARDRQSLEMCEKKGAAKCIVKALKIGRTVALTIDQSINSKQSVDVDFFGHKASQVDSPVRLASKLDAVILPLFSIRDGFEKHRLVFLEPIEVASNMTEEEIQKLSQKLSDILEKQIKEKPEDWFWQHRRWKLYNPEMYQK